jgi:hypothetical protein
LAAHAPHRTGARSPDGVWIALDPMRGPLAPRAAAAASDGRVFRVGTVFIDPRTRDDLEHYFSFYACPSPSTGHDDALKRARREWRWLPAGSSRGAG